MEKLFRYKTLTILWILVILVLTFTPGPNIPPLPEWDIISFDSFVHATIFGLLVFLMANSFARKKSKDLFFNYPIVTSVIISIIFGILIEFFQPFVPGRTFSYQDMLSDSVGAILGIIALYVQHMLVPSSLPFSKSR
jgi:VanZ family protein